MTDLYDIESDTAQIYEERATALKATLSEIDKWLDFYDKAVESEDNLEKYESALAQYTWNMTKLEEKAIWQSKDFWRIAGLAMSHGLEVDMELLGKAASYRSL